MSKDNEAAMENGSRAAHGDPRPARKPSREQQSSLFSDFFTRQYIHVTGHMYIIAVRHLSSDSRGRDDNRFYLYGGFDSVSLFSPHVRESSL